MKCTLLYLLNIDDMSRSSLVGRDSLVVCIRISHDVQMSIRLVSRRAANAGEQGNISIFFHPLPTASLLILFPPQKNPPHTPT